MTPEERELKIFELKWTEQGEGEWVCAHTNIEALMFYLNTCSMSLHDLDKNDEIIEVPKEKWSELYIKNDDFDELNDPEDWKHMSFEEYMKDKKHPDIIATTLF